MLCEKIKLYETRDDVTLTTYIIEDSRELLNGKKRPGIVICPGGANLFLSDREAEAIALRFAGMGYHAFVVRYSVYKSGNMMEIMKPGVHEVDPNSVFPNPVWDIGAAFLEIGKHSDEWLVDMDHLAVCGFSAGGHNALMYSVYWNSDIMTEHFNEPAEKFRPATAIVGYGYGDYKMMRPETVKADKSGLAGAENLIDLSYFGVSDPTDDQFYQASPAKMVTEATPPIFLWTTAGDKMVPPVQTLNMAMALANAGISYEVHVFENGDHGLALADQASASNMEQVNPVVAKWTDFAYEWLKRHMPLDIPEKPAPFRRP